MTQSGSGRTVKQEQEEISQIHVQRINLISVFVQIVNSSLICPQIKKNSTSKHISEIRCSVRAVMSLGCDASSETEASPPSFSFMRHSTRGTLRRNFSSDKIDPKTYCIVPSVLLARLEIRSLFLSGGAECRVDLTLRSRESIHFGFFSDRLCEKNRFMIRELIYVSIHVSFLQYNETWHFMYHYTRFTLFKNRISTSADMVWRIRMDWVKLSFSMADGNNLPTQIHHTSLYYFEVWSYS